MFWMSLISPREDSGVSQVTTARYLPLQSRVGILPGVSSTSRVIASTLLSYSPRKRNSARAGAVCQGTSASFFCRISAKRGDKCTVRPPPPSPPSPALLLAWISLSRFNLTAISSKKGPLYETRVRQNRFSLNGLYDKGYWCLDIFAKLRSH